MNFNTTNSTFRQLMANGLSYSVPAFQRDYSWGPDEWDDLWQDILSLSGDDGEPAHYLGYLVLQSADNKGFEIIDGQQRMTTLSLLMLAAIAHLEGLATSDDVQDPERRRAQQLRGNYIGYLDPVSLVPSSKLRLNRHNDRYYQDYLVPLERLPVRGLNVSERLLRSAFVWFGERIGAYVGDDGAAVARFVDELVDRLFFTVITVTDELNAFRVFETLNARGVRLSATDLLKNYLFSVVAREGAHDSEIKALEARWEGIIGLLGSESFPGFLRVFWNSRNPLVRKTGLFKTIRSSIGDKSAAFALVRDLDQQARVYADLRNPEQGGWMPPERDCLRQLQLYGVRQPFAVLLAAFDRFGEGDRRGFERFLKAIAVVSFRYNLICRRQSNEQEVLYNQVACRISSGEVNSAGEAIDALRPVYPENDAFRAAFVDKSLNSRRDRRVIRFILLRLEWKLSGREFDIESATYNIEHVLPENPGADWDHIDERERDALTHRLGNLTLLEASRNRDLGNVAYHGKRETYRGSQFAITRRLAEEFDDWTPEKIDAHQHWMARQATDIWRIAFRR